MKKQLEACFIILLFSFFVLNLHAESSIEEATESAQLQKSVDKNTNEQSQLASNELNSESVNNTAQADKTNENSEATVSNKKNSWDKIKAEFKKYINTVGHYLYKISQGPRANQPKVLPDEFKETNYVVRKYLNEGSMLYVQVLNDVPMPKEGDIFYTYILEDRGACELEVVSVIEQWALVSNRSCQRFFLVSPGDYLVLKNNKNARKWKIRHSNDYLALWLQYGQTNMSVGNTKFSGDNFRYGFRAALDLSKISRAQINYGVGKNNLSSASSSVEDNFQGVSYSSFHVLGRWSENWQWDFNKFQLVPMLGIGTVFEKLNGHPKFSASGGGPTFGLLIKSDHYKSVVDATLNYCIIDCKILEVGPDLVAIYKRPTIWEARISAKSNILPWPGLGLLTYTEFYSMSADRAYTNSDNSISRSYKENYWGIGLGITYSWN